MAIIPESAAWCKAKITERKEKLKQGGVIPDILSIFSI
jgi:hypothetical protein